ncbi:protein FAR1-RELATED SEQUENCE 5-like [Humulus lupulus]|uniref:protein FAR1-RELATED SEQUENCE 5-like n=1 Tax=Humulus lupulus TaxID=3486 RepID=UPI002B4128BA|nr:protein FAR1-RELATED SEQUENCE 5-like [Humulus lupulus]
MPCQLRDVYNKVAHVKRKEKRCTDSDGALGYLDCLSKRDPNFFIQYQCDVDNRLGNLFWADGYSRRDFVAFSEVIGFDTTYMTNKYNKPLTIILGVNHHFKTCIFGMALLNSEDEQTYFWLLDKFIECHNHVTPKVVVTDGDGAIKNAVLKYFPNATHRLCAWHLCTNTLKISKDPRFLQGFQDVMYNYYTIEEFMQKWGELIHNFDLHSSQWCTNTYHSRRSWVETYLRGKFVAGMRTNQRCESMNSSIKKFLHASYSLREFVTSIDVAMTKLRHIEREDDYNSRQSSPPIPGPKNALKTYHEQCAKLYTRNMYYKVADQIKAEHAYFVNNCEDNGESFSYSLSKFQHEDRVYNVHYHPQEETFTCHCLLFETDGYPCRHIWAVMKYRHMKIVPQSLLLKRWSKNAKADLPLELKQHSTEKQQLFEMARQASLTLDTKLLSYYASKSEQSYTKAKQEVATLTAMFKDAVPLESNIGDNDVERYQTYQENENITRDPTPCRTKGSAYERNNRDNVTIDMSDGAVKTKRKCSNCYSADHNRRTCPQLVGLPLPHSQQPSPSKRA